MTTARMLVALVVALVAGGEAAATSRARPPTVREVVGGGRVAVVGTLRIDRGRTLDRLTADCPTP